MASYQKSPLAPDRFPDLAPVPGVELGAVAAGLRYTGRPDLMLVEFPGGAYAAGVFTRSKMPAAPVDWCRSALSESKGKAKALVVNAGNANAFTGSHGEKATARTASAAAEIIGCDMNEVLLASTGVIGEPLDTSSFPKFLQRIHEGLSTAMWHEVAVAITTTDTFPKGCCRTTFIDGQPVVISGISKGSGMIAPDMATMLGFVFTNANVSSQCLQAILSHATEGSFNSVTVDGDTSTNDTVLAFATGVRANADVIDDPSDPRLAEFVKKFDQVMMDLAQQIVRDGEGATKFVTVTVEGAEDTSAARTIAKAIANSPLVKTAIAGEDPNWGRLVMAVGKSGEKADRDALQIWIGDQKVADKGAVCSNYVEEHAAAHMKTDTILLRVDVGIGSGCASVWTCDLTHGYIDINADYRS
ncbi:bifunctional glutamate N-acetyltransferase/amino-acid acetyltransferase ArgJ [Kordiimonas aquimaris]|uniref:bifunctional glutamate N-acetyltransferase/amino-acid acetyltransferase ArgJ n=1 Tax=Kordiimonas aquimaris TaxID=707591 RepID=UPI0021D16320|nr:bifunctional glutamate N-acetyltransferase/amino-acid acetyltransferase ArgJ [Kordiimonas aquimaris]